VYRIVIWFDVYPIYFNVLPDDHDYHWVDELRIYAGLQVSNPLLLITNARA
jgi:hypothetical protein